MSEKWGKVLVSVLERHSTLLTLEEQLWRLAQHPAFVMEKEGIVGHVWDRAWRIALSNAREYNNKALLHDLLDTDRLVPAKIARQFIDLKGVEHRGKGIKQTPEQVALLVRLAIKHGYPFKPRKKEPDIPTALELVAAFLNCEESIVQSRWYDCPTEKREKFKHEDADSLVARLFDLDRH